MIITQFRKFTPFNMVLLVVLGLLYCFWMFVRLPAESGAQLVEPGMLLPFGQNVVFPLDSRLNLIITLLLTILQALYLNRVMNKYNFFGKPGFLVALMYLTLASLAHSFLVLTPSLICNFIFIRILDKLIGIYHRENAMSTMFDLGLLVALGSLVYFPFAAMLLSVWIGLRLFRPFHWREWAAPLLGFLSVYFLLWVFYLWNDQADQFAAFWTPLIDPTLPAFNPNLQVYLVWVPVLLIMILFLNVLRQNIFKRIVHIRKIVQLLLVMLLISLAAIFLDPDKETSHFLLAVPTLSIYAAYYFHYAATKWFYESVYVILLLLIVIFQFI